MAIHADWYGAQGAHECFAWTMLVLETSAKKEVPDNCSQHLLHFT